MSISVDFIRTNYVYSFSFKNFSSQNNSLKKPKPLSLYLASGGRNSEISIRSSIKHEFRLPESQKSDVSTFSVIPSRKDDEFGRPYFRPIVFKYNFYWSNYARKHIFFLDNFFSTFSSDKSLRFFSEVSSGTSSVLNFNFFIKKNFFRKRFKFFFKKKKFKRLFRYPYFNFRSNGLFFSYLPISANFSFKKVIFNYKMYTSSFKSTIFKKFENLSVSFNNNLYPFNYTNISKFFFNNRFFKLSFAKRCFELSKSISSTFFNNKLSGRRFENKFYRFFKFHFKSKRYFFKRKTFFKRFFKFISDFRFVIKRASFFSKFCPSTFYQFKNFNFNIFSKKIFEFFFLYKFFNISLFDSKITKSYYFKFFKSFIVSKRFKKFKHFFTYFKLYIKLFRPRSTKLSKFFLSTFFFQFFFKFYSRRYNDYSIFNIFKPFFNNLLMLNNFFSVNKFNSCHRTAYIFSYFYFLFFRTRLFMDFNFKNFSTRYFYTGGYKYKFFYFCDIYNSFYNDYNVFSFNRYNDIAVFYKNIFNPNFYSYRISSSRKAGKRFFIATKKVDGTTFFNI